MNATEQLGTLGRMGGILNLMSDWSEQLVTRFAATVRARRQELGLSVQQVADRAAELGHPLNRSTLSDLENGRRGDRLMIGDALALSAALRVPLSTLLYPAQPDGEVELYPEVLVSSVLAAQTLNDEMAVVQQVLSSRDAEVIEWGKGMGILGELARRLTGLRKSLASAQKNFTASVDAGDFDGSDRYLQVIADLEERISELEELVRAHGGVVHDG